MKDQLSYKTTLCGHKSEVSLYHECVSLNDDSIHFLYDQAHFKKSVEL